MTIDMEGKKIAGEFEGVEEGGEVIINGMALLYEKDGTKYVGEFENNTMNGMGALSELNGTKYIGEFYKGTFNGFGMYIQSENEYFMGKFKKGDMLSGRKDDYICRKKD